MADTAAQHYQDLLNAYAAKDAAALSTAGEKLCKTIDNMDVLLGTRREFMLGPWLESAKAWATNDAERKLYEWNARVQITLWGPPEGVLFDYARKQWSGLLVGFHKPRWEQFIAALKESLQAGKPLDSAAFNRQMQQWEDRWTHGTESYPAQPAGDPLEIALRVRPGGRRR